MKQAIRKSVLITVALAIPLLSTGCASTGQRTQTTNGDVLGHVLGSFADAATEAYINKKNYELMDMYQGSH